MTDVRAAERPVSALARALLARRAMRSRGSIWMMLACLAGAACSSTTDGATSPAPSTTPDAGVTGDAATTAAKDPREPCGAGSKAEGDTCTTKLALETSPHKLAPARDHHTTHIFEVNGAPWLYVFGGTPSWATIYDDIWRAPINADGSLGAFETAGKLPHARAGHMSVRVKDKLIFVAGSSLKPSGQPFISDTVDIATFGADGTVSGFTEGPKLPEGVMHHLIAVHGDWLFVFGGRGNSSGASVAQVLRAKLDAQGVPGAFEALPPLPEARSHAMGFQLGDWVYLAGGLTGDPVDNPPPRSDVVRARLNDDGSVGEWEPAGTLPKGGLAVSSAQVFARHVIMFGGLPGGSSYTTKVYSAPIGADGMLGDFEVLPARLPVARAHVHQTPVFRDRIYSVGGHTFSGESLEEVVIGKFTVP